MKNSKKTVLNKIIKVLLKIFITIIIAYNLLYNINDCFNKEHKILNMKYFILQSESMSPQINKNDLIILNSKKDNICENDVVAINDNSTLKLTRIIDKDEQNNTFITKADSNYYFDKKEIIIEEIVGKVKIKIPRIGGFLKMMQSKITTVIIIIFINFIYIINEKKKKISIARRKKRLKEKKFYDSF